MIYYTCSSARGHHVDIGGTKLLEEGKAGSKAGSKAGLEPVAYTATGLRFSDGTSLDADAVVWCTGFAYTDVCNTAAEILGGSSILNGTSEAQMNSDNHVLRAKEIASRLDRTGASMKKVRFGECGSVMLGWMISGLWEGLPRSIAGFRGLWPCRLRLSLRGVCRLRIERRLVCEEVMV